MSHLEAVTLAAGLLLISNLVLVLWVLMMRRDRPWRSARADEVATVVAAPSAMEAVLA